MPIAATQSNAIGQPLPLIAALRRLTATATARLRAQQVRRRCLAGPTRWTCILLELLATTLSALSCYTCAAAQSGVAPSDTPTEAAVPKQAGPWTIYAYTYRTGSHCTAERDVPGGAGRGTTLGFGLIQSHHSAWIGISAGDWELEPNSIFPVEFTAPPFLRSEASAMARSREVVWIEVGLNRALLQKLTAVPEIEIKAAQATFKLPLEQFDRALAELDACVNALKRPPFNPFSMPGTAQRQSQKPAGGHSLNPEPAKSGPERQPQAASLTDARRDGDLIEERTFLTVRGNKSPYRLEALVVRPVKADGRLPIALITHGDFGNAEKNHALQADRMLPQAQDLALRGWLAVVVVRRGFGRSDGLPGVLRTTSVTSCEKRDLARAFDMEADDLEAALEAIAARPDADGSQAIAIGQSLGGGAVLALAARQPAGLLGAVNISGGAWRYEGDQVCSHDALVAAMASLGARTRMATLWLYAENDTLFPPAAVQRMHEAYTKAGGRAGLRMLPPILYDGHNLFADFKGRGYWLRAFDDFLRSQALPNVNAARVDGLMRAAKLPEVLRPHVENYFSAPTPRILVMSPNAVYWAANPDDIDGARMRTLATCRTKPGTQCSVAMENNRLVLPAATGANAQNATTR